MPAKKSSKLTQAASAPPDDRLSRGRTRPETRFTAAPTQAGLPDGYNVTFEEIKNHLQQSRLRSVLAANVMLIATYWQISRIILSRQQDQKWGAKVIDRLSADLQTAFPDMGGLTRRNLFSMRNFAENFPHGPIVKQPVSQLPWGHIIRLLQLVKNPAARDFYIQQAITHGWSRSILEIQIEQQLHRRLGQAQNNFPATLSPADSDLATQIFKDPYLFDFLGTANPRREAEVEQALVDHIQQFLLELGAGFAFVGRQVHLEVGEDDFYLDLLFYHLKLRRYVVIELKARAFEAGDVGQINLYRSAVDDLLRHSDDQPSIGLLLCKGKNKLVVEYALSGLEQSLAVADWKTQLTESLPPEFQGILPSVEEIEAEFAGENFPKDEAHE